MTIDWWTLGIQAVNVIILIWLLARFFWRPVAAMIEQRRAVAQKTLADAESVRRQAADALADITRTRAGFDTERAEILAAAHDDAEAARRTLLATAATEALALREAAKTTIEKERAAAEAAWATRASALAVDIARRLVGRLDGPVVTEAFLAGLLLEVQALPATERTAATASGASLEVVSASAIAPAEQDHTRSAIAEALGLHPETRLQIAFQVDPTLVAGIELHGPNLIVANSWRADLVRILADLAHDTGS